MEQLEVLKNIVEELKAHTHKPDQFFEKQKKLYECETFFKNSSSPTNSHGLPKTTEQFYSLNKSTKSVSKDSYRILNIGSSGDGTRNLAAVNLDLDGSENADAVYDGVHIPFPDNYFTVVRASHVLEHIERDKLLDTLREWMRVLHPDGELHIAVPDAEVTFREILTGVTPKGAPALSSKVTTAPLTQIFGLGYENLNTDPRWRHHVLFNKNLLRHYLQSAGLEVIRDSSNSDNLAFLCGIKDDSQSHYSLNVIASRPKTPSADAKFLTTEEFALRCNEYVSQHGAAPDISFIVPVYNEADSLPHFLASLEESEYRLGNNIEFVFVLNGCNDDSEKIIKTYAQQSKLRITLAKSDKGINNAFIAGEKARQHSGLVGKLDADVTLHPHAIDLLTMHLLRNNQLEVVYAESIPINAENRYNEVEHNQHLRSKRLYYHGRACLFRNNPCKIRMYTQNSTKLLCEDVFLSYYFAYFKGLQVMSPTPYCNIYSRPPDNFPDLELQRSRLAQEIRSVHEIFPPFAILDSIFEREVYSSSYRKLLNKVRTNGVVLKEWHKIRS